MVHGKCLTKDLVQHMLGMFMLLLLSFSVSLQCMIFLSTLRILVLFPRSFPENFSQENISYQVLIFMN